MTRLPSVATRWLVGAAAAATLAALATPGTAASSTTSWDAPVLVSRATMGSRWMAVQ